MKYDMQLLVILVFIGLFRKNIQWRGWFAITMFVLTWIMYNWLRT
jgi:hypothetical protein